MKVKNVCICNRCKDIAKINDIAFKNDSIFAEYICDCGAMTYTVIDTIEYV